MDQLDSGDILDRRSEFTLANVDNLVVRQSKHTHSGSILLQDRDISWNSWYLFMRVASLHKIS